MNNTWLLSSVCISQHIIYCSLKRGVIPQNMSLEYLIQMAKISKTSLNNSSNQTWGQFQLINSKFIDSNSILYLLSS